MVRVICWLDLEPSLEHDWDVLWSGVQGRWGEDLHLQAWGYQSGKVRWPEIEELKAQSFFFFFF